MDIKKLQDGRSQYEEAADVPISPPEGEIEGETPLVFRVLSRHAKSVQRVINRQAKANARRRSDLTAAELYEQRVERAMAALVGWTGLEDAGKPVSFSADLAQSILGDPHYLEQVEEGMVGHARFFKKASVSSPPT